MNNPISPYIVGQVLKEDASFFGRGEIVKWVVKRLAKSNSLVLFGQRRIGKSSLLRYLERVLPSYDLSSRDQHSRDLPSRRCLPIYFDLAEQTTKPLEIVLAQLAREMTKKLGNLEPPHSSTFDNQGYSFQHKFLPEFYKALGDNYSPVFLLDEFDALDGKQALEPNAAAKSLLPFIRRLMDEDRRSVFIFVIGRQTDDLSVDIKATFKSILKKEVWVLDRNDAEKLILQAWENNTLEFEKTATDRILELTNGHPFLTQLICNVIWEQAYQEGPDSLPLISKTEVEAALPVALDEGDNILVWLWDGLSLAEKIYAAALAQISHEGDLIKKDQVMEVLKNHAARLQIGEADSAARDLVQRRVLERDGRDYHFAVEIFRRWVKKRKPLDDIKDEIDQAEPKADRFHKIGSTFANLREWQNAIFQFEKALEINPRHFKAMLYMGEALLELNRINEAVRILEQAYELDREQSAFLLARALEAQISSTEDDRDEDDILAVCERILKIHPKSEFAKEKKTAIWTRRGDCAMEHDDLESSMKYYREADAPDKIKITAILLQLANPMRIEKRLELWADARNMFEKFVNDFEDEPTKSIWKKKLNQYEKLTEQLNVEKKALDYVQIKAWRKAADVYGQLFVESGDIDEERKAYWQKSLDICGEEGDIAEFFEEGLKAMGQRQWQKARDALIKVINLRPTFRKNNVWATELLNQLAKKSPYILKPLLPVLKSGRKISVDNAGQIIPIASHEIPGMRVAAYTPNGNLICTGSKQAVYFFNSFTLDSSTIEEPAFKTNVSVETMTISPDGEKFALGMGDGTVEVRDILDGSPIFFVPEAHLKSVNCIKFSPDGNIIASGGNDGVIHLWHTENGSMLEPADKNPKENLGQIWDIDFSRNGEKLAVTFSLNGKDVWLLSVDNMALSRKLSGHTSSVWKVCFSPDGETLASASSDNTIRLWNFSSGGSLHILKAHKMSVDVIAYSPDGTILASGSRDKTLRLWDTANGKLLHTFADFEGDVNSAAFSPDGTALVTLSNKTRANRNVSKIQLWRVDN